MLRKVGADLVWAPPVSLMYPADFATRIAPEGPARAGLEDATRPHFFGGVATVVGKLLLQCLPDIAVFGEKDFQQLRVVTQMVKDLDIPVRIIGGRTVREKDGLAMSSRNAYLSAAERAPGRDALCRAAGVRREDRRGKADRDHTREWASRAQAGRVCSRVSGSPQRRNSRADRLTGGWSGTAAGCGETRQDAADRQYRGCAAVIHSSQKVMQFERRVAAAGPFYARSGALAAAVVNRKPQALQQTPNLLACGDVRQRRLTAERLRIERVERGEAARKEFAVDDALGKSFGEAERQSMGELVEAVGHRLLVA